MIYITGDTHGSQNRFIYSREEKNWKKDDIVLFAEILDSCLKTA